MASRSLSFFKFQSKPQLGM
ncbi:BnaA09g00930D [Brassica napus]|uniref:BnaA09g00930D protein n=1 Tax=Brassica napus TaxID=3708 RepID=A0A078G9P6_BRANA|nr:BnaA09g00930D [Brassica napus]